MRYVPPFAALEKWMAGHIATGTGRLAPAYDDVLDVLKEFLQAIPVDGDWYQAEYPAIRDYLARMPDESPASHFAKHGYFEARKPFAPGWRGLTAPAPFAHLKTRLRVFPARGRLRVDIARDEFLAVINTLLISVPVDQAWYRATYPDAARLIDDGTFSSVAGHYAERGFSEGRLPFDPEVDEDWYISRYDHVRTGLERGVARSAQEHFIRVGYKEGCRPTPR